jgi:5-methylthioadenosine/S-adenosylhomocysteine deaminase
MQRLRPALYLARWVLPVSAPPIPDGGVLVGEDGKIAAVGPRASIDSAPDTEVVELGKTILLPGLVNVHAHPELAMYRGALEDLPFRDWIMRLVGSKRAALRDEDHTDAALWTAVEAIQAGITTLGATESTAAAVAAFREAGLRGIVYQEVFGPDPAQVDGSMAELTDRLDELVPLETELVRIGVSPHAPYTVSDDLYRAATRLSLERGLPMALHISESRAESELVASGEGDFAAGLRARGIPLPPRGRTPIEMLDRLGVLEARPLLIHCVTVDEGDVSRIAAAGCAVAHCPVANARLGHGIAPVPALRAAGVVVGMGTDSVGSNNRLDLLEEARIASLLQRASGRDHGILPASELLRLCTIEGARALRIEDRVGTLEPGKDADLCAVSVAAPHARPVHDPVAALFHAARSCDVVLTAVRGRVLYRDGSLTGLDAAEVGGRMDEIAQRLREHL